MSPSEIINNLFPNLWIFLANTLTVISLLFILSKLVYRPLKHALHLRSKKIKDTLIAANNDKQKALKQKLEAQKQLTKTINDSNLMLKVAKKQGILQKNKIIVEAKSLATKIVADAKLNAKAEQEANKTKIQQLIIHTAISIATKIVDLEINSKKHQELIDKAINQI